MEWVLLAQGGLTPPAVMGGFLPFGYDDHLPPDLLTKSGFEKRVADMHRTSGISDEAWQDLQATLDEALRQVPEKYRLPLLLCYLEGKTQPEAARQLGCPAGTIFSRLARGREMLRNRLLRRGLTLSAVALTAALTQHVAAAIPASAITILLAPKVLARYWKNR